MTDIDIVEQLGIYLGRTFEKVDFIYIVSNRFINNAYYSTDRNGNINGLVITNCNLKKIPLLVSQLTSLKILNLSSNQITDLSILKHLTELIELYLQDNEVGDIFPLKDLCKLNRLRLQNNPIKRLPNWVTEFAIGIEWLKNSHNNSLTFYNNPIENLPIEIVSRGKAAIKSYFEDLEKQGKEYLYEAKMLIVGQPRAGKTSLRYKLFDTTLPLPGEDKTTRGIDIERLTFDIIDSEGRQQKFNYNVWDFGGQQIYHTTHQFFLTRRSLYAVVMDTGKDPIGNDDTTINYWLQAIELLGDNSPTFLVLNEKNEREVNIDFAQKKARFNFLRKDYSVDLNALIPGTSAYSPERLDDFKKLKSDIEFELRRLPWIGFPMPINWIKIRNRLQELSVSNPYISKQDYISICKVFDVGESERQLGLSRIFHDLGVFLHFQDFPLLEDFIILQNVWATDAVFAVIDNEGVRRNKGKFTDTELEKIWINKGYEKEMHNKLLGLMMQFELCYQVDNVRPFTYIFPEMLSINSPKNYKWVPNGDLPLYYRYDFMPKGLLTRLIVRLHKYICMHDEQQIVWKTGVMIDGNLLDCPNTFVEIIEAWDNKQLSIRAQGMFAKDIMSKIAFQIDTLNNEVFSHVNSDAEQQKSKWHKMVPCNCILCRNIEDKYYYDYSVILSAKMKKKQIQCQKSFEGVNVNELLDGVFGLDKQMKKVFISYSQHDEKWKNKFIKNLASLRNQELISEWHDRQIEIGFWDEQITEAMENADIFILLITQNYLNSSYITSQEIAKAYSLYKLGRAKIFPVICEPCDWEIQPITKEEKEIHPRFKREMYIWMGKFQAFPKRGKPIKKWSSQQEGFLDVINQLKMNLFSVSESSI